MKKPPPPDTDRKVLVLSKDKHVYIGQYVSYYNFWGKFIGKRFVNSFSKFSFEIDADDWEEINLPSRWEKIVTTAKND